MGEGLVHMDFLYMLDNTYTTQGLCKCENACERLAPSWQKHLLSKAMFGV